MKSYYLYYSTHTVQAELKNEVNLVSYLHIVRYSHMKANNTTIGQRVEKLFIIIGSTKQRWENTNTLYENMLVTYLQFAKKISPEIFTSENVREKRKGLQRLWRLVH